MPVLVGCLSVIAAVVVIVMLFFAGYPIGYEIPTTLAPKRTKFVGSLPPPSSLPISGSLFDLSGLGIYPVYWPL